MSKFAAVALAATLSAVSFAAAAAPTPNECRKTMAVDFHGTIVDAAIATPSLSTLTSLLVAADLVGTLSAPGNFTVYAPTNDAFAKIPSGVLGAISADITVLTSVLTYHVVDGAADPRVKDKREVTTLQGQTVLSGYGKNVGPMTNQSIADCTAVKTTNGTVWIINSVMFPQFN